MFSGSKPKTREIVKSNFASALLSSQSDVLALQVSGIVQYKSKQFSKSTDFWNVLFDRQQRVNVVFGENVHVLRTHIWQLVLDQFKKGVVVAIDAY